MQGKYYLGLDIGTNSVGYAVTDYEYNILRFKGEHMWGSHVFDNGNQSAERRGFRTARRRLDRKQQRVALVKELFAEEIAKVDDRFFIRLKESALFAEDRTNGNRSIVFDDPDFKDKDYYLKYPTIHHLICDLIESDEPKDVRLVYIAVAWLVSHRGHFLSEVDKNNIADILDFHGVYESLMDYFVENGMDKPWDCDPEDFGKILLKKENISSKEKDFYELLYGGNKPKSDDEEDILGIDMMIKLLSGGKVDLSKLFLKKDYEEKVGISFNMAEDVFEETLSHLDEEIDLLLKLRGVYDWALLYEASQGDKFISKAKVRVYDIHKQDLKNLKDFTRKYKHEKYNEIFRKNIEGNYVSYSYNVSSLNKNNRPKNKASKIVFCDYLRKIFKDVKPDTEDVAFYVDMMNRLELYTFLPKQVESDNRVIPYQLYYFELNEILMKAEKYLSFLDCKDEQGLSVKDKLLSIMEFRIPYFVGPLHKGNGSNSWIEKKATGRIYPWNFSDMVDLDASEKNFIDKMLNRCTYWPAKNVVAKNSLVYQKFEVLNEINNIKINAVPLSVEAKQGIFNLFKEFRKVSVKKIKDYLVSNNYMSLSGDELSGIDISIKSSLKTYHDFKRLLENNILSRTQVEDIIEHITYSEDKRRIKNYLLREYKLSDEDIKYVCKLKYSDFGRLSKEFLTELKAVDKSTGEFVSIMDTLWNTNLNLMQIINDEEDFGFKELLSEINKDFYSGENFNLDDMLDNMYISNAVKRPIYRTLAVVKDVVNATGTAPNRIFIEMAREVGEKGKRTESRRTQIENLYKNFDKNEVRELSELLDSKSDNELQSEVLYLYFMQLGKCMYSGEPINIENIKNDQYVNIDHIYPQAYVKDDSLDNKVLVLSKLNGEKGDEYPIRNNIRANMANIWKIYRDRNLISQRKYERLVRSTPFTQDEKQGFINRQLVETRQSTKALAEILKHLYPDTTIVYVKAALASSFKKEFGIVKSRNINDLHHAKDAYLNIVCGNVYYSKFTRNFILQNDKYSIKTSTVYGREVKVGNSIIWKGESDIAKVKKIVSRNDIHFTRYCYCRKGGLFDQNPLKASEGLIPMKSGLDTSKYGGYNKSTASFFLLTSYVENTKKSTKDIMIVPVELMYSDRVKNNLDYAKEYVRNQIAQINNKNAGDITNIDFPFGLRPIKVNTKFIVDGLDLSITKKDNAKVGFINNMPLLIGDKNEKYFKKIERYLEKISKNPNIKLNEQYDGICAENNIVLYDCMLEKITNESFKNATFANVQAVFEKYRASFITDPLEKQAVVLGRFVDIFKTGRSGRVDLTVIDGSKNAGDNSKSMKISNWKKKYSDLRILDESPAGLFTTVSENILEYL